MSAQTKERESYEQLTHVLAEFDSPGELIVAAKKVRDAGYTRFDCHSPFPVHGIDPAMGIKMTILPWIVFGAGAFGLIFSLFFQHYLNAQVVPVAGRFSGWDWVISGKPGWAVPANIPIMFEFTVLLAAFATFLGMWGLNKLPQVWHPLFQSESFGRSSDDAFFISVEAEDPKFDEARTRAFLDEIGATAIESIRIVTGPVHRKMPKSIVGFILVTAMLALVPFAFIAKARAEKSSKPHFHVIPNMDFQPSVGAQDAFQPFADERSAQLYPAGTVAWGRDSTERPSADELAADDLFYRGVEGEEWARAFPEQLELDMDFMRWGQNRYDIYCAPCHGESGDGLGVIQVRAEEVGAPATGWNQPTNLLEARPARLPHGQIFNTITHGTNTMPAYGSQIPARDRWAIIFYMRALQRAECDSLEGIPTDMRGRIKGARSGAPQPGTAPAPGAAGDEPGGASPGGDDGTGDDGTGDDGTGDDGTGDDGTGTGE